ncbi:MAG: GcvT family protein [Rhodospirillaceae bacterium]|jgi:glycine cleavage system T protein|nr:GcvT family protein [Rhodospirillaceae bacterium]MBT5081163.1 GcvT family protein [Rhodospirillaceae bacterium]MBT5523529.1 GcvT family protein [Rhodospirillaceae bacterium]MBT5880496.1 GcvT family protein [Rhodospirillaceae bacterium]MBT6591448.1 GcvT family protein [Rhodospirillaceae bacterium]
MPKSVPNHASVVIVGGGVVGCSIAYHLVKLGITDVLLLERKQLSSGTTWHAAGLVGQLRATQNLTQLAKYSTELYAGLEAETGQATGFKQNGSISLATNGERMEELRRGASMARVFGLAVEEIDQNDIRRMHPLLNVDDVVGGVFLPKDGQINPSDLTQALAKGARAGGATVLENIKVTDISTEGGRVTGVEIEDGHISADIVVNCTGMWGRSVGGFTNTLIPLHACEHFYVVTDPIAGVTPDLPVLRDPDNFAYFKEDAGKILLGAFEPEAKPWGMDGIPEDFCFDELPNDMEHFMPVLERALNRMPALQETGIRTWFCGPESFTPDNRYHLGEVPDVTGLFVACGFNSIGIQSAGGVGKVMAEWIRNGYAPLDLWDVDIRRTLPHQSNPRFLKERVSECLGLLYAPHWPFYQYRTARGVRKSPLHDRLVNAGAAFGEAAGWERANWYAPGVTDPQYEYSYGRQNWFEYSAAEHLAVRESVALFDQTSFAKFQLSGRDAVAVLNQVCANEVDVAIGRTVYTQWLNARGGIEADLTVTRTEADEFLIVTSATSQVRDFHWLKSHIPTDAHAHLTDLTSAQAVISIMGPKSRDLLAGLTDADVSNAAFPFGTSQLLNIAYATVRATRLTYVGELGWELYIPSEFVPGVYDEIVAAGAKFGLVHAGYHAMDSLRIEKAYRHWGHDITDEDTPLEAGLGFAVAWDKPGGFIGREALLAQREAGTHQRLVQFRLTDPEKLLYHNEPIWRDGVIVGHLRSGNYGHSLGAAIGLGYVQDPEGGVVDAAFVNAGTYEIEVACERVEATASLRPFYDPKSINIKA